MKESRTSAASPILVPVASVITTVLVSGVPTTEAGAGVVAPTQTLLIQPGPAIIVKAGPTTTPVSVSKTMVMVSAAVEPTPTAAVAAVAVPRAQVPLQTPVVVSPVRIVTVAVAVAVVKSMV
ncbi:hypothetical protein ES703_87124 [subsurface metagenome]